MKKNRGATTVMFSALIVGLILIDPPCTIAQQTNFENLIADAETAFGYGKFADAEKTYLEALERSNEIPEGTTRQSVILNSLATIYNLEGRYPDAESLCLRAITMIESTSGKTDPVLADILNTLGSVNLHFYDHRDSCKCVAQLNWPEG
jgi:hypothetical protein